MLLLACLLDFEDPTLICRPFRAQFLGACLPRPPFAGAHSDLGYEMSARWASAADYIRLLIVAPEQIDRVVRPSGPVSHSPGRSEAEAWVSTYPRDEP